MSVERGVGSCPKNPGGHVWVSWQVDSRKPCKFCGRPGRDNTPLGGTHTTGGFFAEATAARADVFAGLGQPKSVTGWGKQS